MVRVQGGGVLQLELPTEYDQEKIMALTCEECGKMCANQRGLSIHLSRIHGIKEERPEPASKNVKRVSLKLEERYTMIEYFKANKARIEEKRLNKVEVLEEVKVLLKRDDLNESHLNEPAKIGGVTWVRGVRKSVVVKADTQLLMDYALLFGEIWAKLGDLLGDEPRLLQQAKEHLREELRKEQSNGNGVEHENTD